MCIEGQETTASTATTKLEEREKNLYNSSGEKKASIIWIKRNLVDLKRRLRVWSMGEKWDIVFEMFV